MSTPLRQQHIASLDGVRAIAASLVLYAHLFPGEAIHDFQNWGYIGVRVFFVLSGFLITGILLDARAMAEAATEGVPFGVVANFYARRAFRIFPIYFLVVFSILLVCDWISDFQRLALLTYTTNWFVCWNGPDGLVGGHFWSLAVEEQFYLIWPWIILFVPRRYLPGAILSAIFIAVATRLVLISLHFSVITVTFNTPGCFDTLGMGALLALIRRSPRGRFTHVWLRRWALRIAVLLFFISVPIPWWPTHYILIFTLQDLFWSCLFVAWIDVMAEGGSGPMRSLLASKPFVLIGRISYGLYVYHTFMIDLLPYWFTRLGWHYPEPGYFRTGLLLLATFGIATISWRIIEAPINRLKEKFPYQSERSRPLTHVRS